ncbi:hypothetical protein FRB99_008822 [Tulasnella sp. 403]|nr:hypothetical protein FRB99_008822 [Tulasnella sp. 403]
MLFRYRRPFSGSGGEECEEFISAVRHYAFELGKQRDNQWIADFASTAFSGDALRWFMTLDVTVQGDWRLLAKALLEKYSSLPESPRVHRRMTLPSAMIPTPAAAAPTLPRTTALTPQRPIQGTIHVLVENEPERNGLLSRFLNPYGWHVPTQSPQDAIRVSAIPFGKYVKMKFINSPTSFDWLGLTWNRPRPIEPANHLAPDAIFSAVARPFAAVAKSTSKSYEGHTEVALWDIASDGRMTLIWSDEKAVLWDLSIRINSADVLFVASRQHCKVAEGHRVVRLAFVPE